MENQHQKHKIQWTSIWLPILVSLLVSLAAHIYALGEKNNELRHLQEDIVELKAELKIEKDGMRNVEQKADKIDAELNKQELIIKIIFENLLKKDPNAVLQEYVKTK